MILPMDLSGAPVGSAKEISEEQLFSLMTAQGMPTSREDGRIVIFHPLLGGRFVQLTASEKDRFFPRLSSPAPPVAFELKFPVASAVLEAFNGIYMIASDIEKLSEELDHAGTAN